MSGNPDDRSLARGDDKRKAVLTEGRTLTDVFELSDWTNEHDVVDVDDKGKHVTVAEFKRKYEASGEAESACGEPSAAQSSKRCKVSGGVRETNVGLPPDLYTIHMPPNKCGMCGWKQQSPLVRYIPPPGACVNSPPYMDLCCQCGQLTGLAWMMRSGLMSVQKRALLNIQLDSTMRCLTHDGAFQLSEVKYHRQFLETYSDIEFSDADQEEHEQSPSPPLFTPESDDEADEA